MVALKSVKSVKSVVLLLQLHRRVVISAAAAIRAAVVVATLGDVLLTGCSGSDLRATYSAEY